jgi:hypothetical protein
MYVSEMNEVCILFLLIQQGNTCQLQEAFVSFFEIRLTTKLSATLSKVLEVLTVKLSMYK